MTIRTICFKVDDLDQACQFWHEFLEISPHKKSEKWCEFMVESTRLALFKNPGDVISGSNCVPIFEFEDEEIMEYVERAKQLGATILEDSLDNPAVMSILLEDPSGNEFEICKLHD